MDKDTPSDLNSSASKMIQTEDSSLSLEIADTLESNSATNDNPESTRDNESPANFASSTALVTPQTLGMYYYSLA